MCFGLEDNSEGDKFGYRNTNKNKNIGIYEFGNLRI
jgi:hypothetical protein